MKSSNPFLPAGELVAERQRRNRERVKIGVFAVLLAHLVLVMGLLIEGCKRDEKVTTSTETPSDSVAAQTNQVLATEQAQTTNAPASVVAPPSVAPMPAPSVAEVPPAPQPEPVVAPVAAKPEPGVANPESIYLVKSGDTLSRIAKTHKTTVRALKAANRLKTDRIEVGRKLKLPVAVVSKEQN